MNDKERFNETQRECCSLTAEKQTKKKKKNVSEPIGPEQEGNEETAPLAVRSQTQQNIWHDRTDMRCIFEHWSKWFELPDIQTGTFNCQHDKCLNMISEHKQFSLFVCYCSSVFSQNLITITSIRVIIRKKIVIWDFKNTVVIYREESHNIRSKSCNILMIILQEKKS